jgi:hypothetical protein
MAKQVRFVGPDKIVKRFGDQTLAGIQFGGTDLAPSFENISGRTGKFFSMVQVATNHNRAVKIEVGGRQGFWPRDTWTQPLTCTFNTPGGATDLSMPLSIASSTSVARVFQGLSHCSFVDACELEHEDIREFLITNGTGFDYDFVVFRMLPDRLNEDARTPNRQFLIFTSGGAGWTWTQVNDPREWFDYIPRWYRFISTSLTPIVAQPPLPSNQGWNPPDVRDQFSHTLTLRFRRSQVHTPVAYPITFEIRSSGGTVLETFAITIPVDDTIQTRFFTMPIGESFMNFRISVPAEAKFELQAYTERTYAP